MDLLHEWRNRGRDVVQVRRIRHAFYRASMPVRILMVMTPLGIGMVVGSEFTAHPGHYWGPALILSYLLALIIVTLTAKVHLRLPNRTMRIKIGGERNG